MTGTPCFLLEQAPISIGEFVPHKIQDPDASGYGVTEEENIFLAPGEKPFANVPNVNFNRDNRQVKLNSNPADNSNDNLAVPSLLDFPSRSLALAAGDRFFMK